MRRESGPLTSMGTFIRTQFDLQGLPNELKLHPFCAPTEYHKGTSCISVSPPPFLRWRARCYYWMLLICAPPSPIFACQKTTEVSKFLQRRVRDLSEPGTRLTASLVSTVMQVVPGPGGVRTGNPTGKNRKADQWLGLGVQELLHLSFGEGGVQTQNLGVPNLARD